MHKTRLLAIIMASLMLIIIFGASYTASADPVVSVGVYVRKEGTEDPINPTKVRVWYTRLHVPFPEEKEAEYIPQIGCWYFGASLKHGSVSFKIRVRVGDTEQVREVHDLVENPNGYAEYFYFHVNDNPRNKNQLLVNFLETLFEKFNWQFPILRVLQYLLIN